MAPSRQDSFNQYNDAAIKALQLAKSEEATRLFKAALTTAKAAGRDNPDIATGLNNLACLYTQQCHYEKAERLYRRALAMRKTLGMAHPTITIVLNNLADLYGRQGLYARAELLLRGALGEKTLSVDSRETATIQNGLAMILQRQGKYSEAEILYRHALLTRMKAFGQNHPDVATTLANLAALYLSQEEFSESTSLYTVALGISERLADSRLSVACLNGLGVANYAQGRLTESEILYNRALAILDRASIDARGQRVISLAGDHFDFAALLHNLAAIKADQSKYSEAETLFRRALVIAEDSFGSNHRNLVDILKSLANLYLAQGKREELKQTYVRLVALVAPAERPNVMASTLFAAGA